MGITKHAHFYWGNTTLPWFQYVSIRSFRRVHPDWRVTLWCPYEKATCYVVPDHFAALRAAGVEITEIDPVATTGCSLVGYSQDHAWAQVSNSDALRHWLLYTYGGLWSDTDVFWLRRVEGSSIFAPDVPQRVSLCWRSDTPHTAVIYADPGAPALRQLLDRQRAMSPAYQVPGGQGPYGPGLWLEFFHSTSEIPDFVPAAEEELMWPLSSESFAFHARGARVPWASLSAENYTSVCAEIPDLVAALERVLA